MKKNKNNHVMNIRVSEPLFKIIEEHAENDVIPPATWVRQFLNKELMPKLIKEEKTGNIHRNYHYEKGKK